MRVFEEKQRFTQWWLWLLMLFSLGAIFLDPIMNNFKVGDWFWISFLIILGVMVFLSNCALSTEIDETGINYKFIPFQGKEKNIPWNDIKTCYTRQYKPIKEYGGWGYRASFGKGKAYNIKGNQGIQIELKDGTKLLIGTQKPIEAQKVIDRYFKK